MDIDSTVAYRPLWLCFRLLAPAFFGANWQSVYIYVYMFLMNLLVTLLFPLHLLMGLLLQANPADWFKNLTISLTCFACSLKHIVQLCILPQMLEIRELLKQLDKCIQSEEEKDYFRQTLQRSVKRLTLSFYITYFVVYLLFLTGVLITILSGTKELIYLAWFPFNWQGSSHLFHLAFCYQLFSILAEGIQGLTNDIFSPLTLCYLSGHIHLLSIRVSQLGYQQLPDNEVYQQLRACFQDFRVLMRLLELTRQTVSIVQLIQICACGLNICIVVIYVIFYVNDIVSIIYNIVYFTVICIQLYPSCYFASALIAETERLPHAIFSGNWYEQSALYKRNIIIFTQLTLRLLKSRVMAGGIIELNLKAFFTTVKMAYSLFALVMQLKEN